jgi:hypothetical protein
MPITFLGVLGLDVGIALELDEEVHEVKLDYH